MRGYEFNPAASDRALLRGFVDYCVSLLEDMVLKRDIPVPIDLIDGLDAYMPDAWKETQPSIEHLRRRISDVAVGKLERAGLIGRSLRAKLHILKHRVDQVVGGAVQFFWDVINNLNDLLASLLQATGAGEALKELKEMFERGRKDIDDNHPPKKGKAK